jgi:oxaloacetate decarboxylase gamma subunit
MTIAIMMGQSSYLTILGMAIVFSFLVIMIIAITVVGKIIRVLHLDKDLNAVPAAGPAPAQSGADAAVTAAISAAVNEYRKQ